MNIIDFVILNKNKTFDELPFCEVDSLIFSQLAYTYFDNAVPNLGFFKKAVTLKSVINHPDFEKMLLNVIDPKKEKMLLLASANSLRYSDVLLNFYINQLDTDIEKQFSAVTFLTNDFAYLAFRGTDSTITGWKEDFNLAFLKEIPSQIEALKYLNSVSKKTRKKLILGGHSKGGNLAVYSAINAKPSIQKRILAIFNHDGPGFRDEVFSLSSYDKIKDKIQKTVPKSAFVGMLLQHHEPYKIVESSRFGIMQHDPFSWLVDGDKFLYYKEITPSAKYTNMALSSWLESVDYEKRKRFIDVLFSLLSTTNARSFTELSSDWLFSAKSVLKEVNNIDKETKDFIFETIISLFKVFKKQFFESIIG